MTRMPRGLLTNSKSHVHGAELYMTEYYQIVVCKELLSGKSIQNSVTQLQKRELGV